MKTIFFLALTLYSIMGQSQSLTGNQLLERSISFHDPANNWPTFNGSITVRMETPNSSDRLSQILIDLPGQRFALKASRDRTTTEYYLDGEQCTLKLNGSTEFSEEEAQTNRLNCERGRMYRNYYTYLYGLPMKLRDPGTHIDPKVESRTFKGKEYLVLKATYDQEVGSDVWFIYFDPETYAMEVYQFYKGEPDGAGKDTGEYILLSGMEEVQGIKMPKKRAWYYNKDDKYLGTDILEE